MSDWSSPPSVAQPLFVSAAGHLGPYLASRNYTAGGAAAVRTWVAKLVSYCPMLIPCAYPVNRVFWVNGSTNTTTNVDFGIYTAADGTRIYNTGSTVMGTVSTVQYVTPGTTFVLDAGKYYFAWTCDNTTSRGYTASGSANSGRMTGMLEETTGSFGLPATMTPVAFARAWGPSICGVTRTTTGF